ncbi:odorant receptor 46a-like isoform X1 [Daktulosphaira vitifoliae]|uniref:odorant receptor 46a-like isoform X1 n=1 Tax=Daktulosphaira vitifoliae TaxID=58002 RepID=UPI0021AAA958|nr:odorant receptor 46a-like isoform X1 [Daktulosphaira vitifoliae]
MRNRNGNWIVYRNNVVNIFLVYFSFDNYKHFYWIIYIIETIIVTQVILDIIIRDVAVIELCMILTSQLESIALEFESLGYQIKNTDTKKMIKMSTIDNFKHIILDHKKVNMVIKNFYDIFKPIAILQLGITYNLIIGLIFTCVMNFLNNDILLLVVLLKLFFTTIGVIMNLFVWCFFYGYLENQKNKMNFFMYSCNWTEQNLEFQKILLLTMKLNNANNFTMKVTPTKVFNLEMFSRVMNTSYSIVSILLKKKIR